MLAMVIHRPAGAQSPDLKTVTIVNSGSTNRAGFRIVIDDSGAAAWTSSRRRFGPENAQTAEPVQRKLPRASVDRLFADLTAARPLASLPAAHCGKSVSFGSTLTVLFGGEQTSDLSCGDGGNAAMRDLIHDVNEIVALFQGK